MMALCRFGLLFQRFSDACCLDFEDKDGDCTYVQIVGNTANSYSVLSPKNKIKINIEDFVL